MRKLISLLALLGSFAIAHAQTYSVTLSPEAGEGRSGSGSGTLTLSGDTLTFDPPGLSYSGLSTPSINAHIHGPTTGSAVFPNSAGVMYGLGNNTTFGEASGTFTGSVTLMDGVNGQTISDQIADLNAGRWYINIHSEMFTGGEIRGQLVPEPSTYALALLGAAFLWRWRRRV